jgi:4-amino-4-deoxy-L-arabinose transferase-like glycosyltransferase
MVKPLSSIRQSLSIQHSPFSTPETLTSFEISRRWILPLLLTMAVAVYFVNLGASSIWDANEAFYVETPREMMERGDYITPTFNYQPRLNKPVLSYWIVAGFYHLFGVSVAVQRIPIALGAMVIIAAAFFLARTAYPTPVKLPSPGPAGTGLPSVASAKGAALLAGLWAALGLAASPRLLMFARRIFIDIYISMFMALTLLFFALSERYPERRRLFLILMYVSVGLGVLTKGPAFALLPGLVFAVYLVVHREVHRAREMLIPAGLLIVAAIVVPWYAALYQRYGWTYIVSFVLGENLARYTDGVGVSASRGPLFYLPVVFSDSFPWSIFLFVAGAAWLAERRRSAASRGAGYRIRTLLWIWILTIAGFFSLSQAKQDLYIFPIVPAVAALAGIAIGEAIAEGRRIRAVRFSTGALAVLVMGLGAAMLYLFLGSEAVYALRGTRVIGGMGLIGGAIALLLAARASVRTALAAVVATIVAMNWTFVLRVLPSFEAYKPVPGFARVLEARAGPDDVIAAYNVAVPSLVYYLRRRIETSYSVDPIRQLIDAKQTVYLILPREDYDAIRSQSTTPTCIVTSQPTFDVKLRNILAREALPDLLLITNRCGA